MRRFFKVTLFFLTLTLTLSTFTFSDNSPVKKDVCAQDFYCDISIINNSVDQVRIAEECPLGTTTNSTICSTSFMNSNVSNIMNNSFSSNAGVTDCLRNPGLFDYTCLVRCLPEDNNSNNTNLSINSFNSSLASCRINTDNLCADGKVPFQEKLSAGEFDFLVLTRNQLNQHLELQYKSTFESAGREYSSQYLCINNNISSFILNTGIDIGDQNGIDSIEIGEAPGIVDFFARGCESPRIPSLFSKVLNNVTYDLGLCCSSGERAVANENQTNFPTFNAYLSSPGTYGCCPNGGVKFRDGRCFNANNIDVGQVRTANQDPSILGVGLFNQLVVGDLNQTFNTCPTNTCAILSDGNGGYSFADPESINAGNSNQCTRCMQDGEYLGISNETNRLLLCNASNPTSPTSVELVNGNASDTIACLRSEGGYNSPNFNACKSCRESGGTWSGLGCVDSTPPGIITWIIRIAYGVMGGVALIQFIIAGIYYQTGQESKVAEARKSIIATITGLAVLTFSILILRIIGINILDILPIGSI